MAGPHQRTRTTGDINNESLRAFKSALHRIDWGEVYKHKEVNVAYDSFFEIFMPVFNLHNQKSLGSISTGTKTDNARRLHLHRGNIERLRREIYCILGKEEEISLSDYFTVDDEDLSLSPDSLNDYF